MRVSRAASVIGLLLMAHPVLGAQAVAQPTTHRPPADRLPAGYHRGRCLYVVEGRPRIDGRCFYRRDRDGSLHIDGPRQRFGGTDTVDRGASALTWSRDWWVEVFPDEGGWSAYGNEAVADVHGGSPWALRRRGRCFTGERVAICLWAR